MMNIIKKYNKNYTQYDDRICLIYNIKIKNKNSMGAGISQRLFWSIWVIVIFNL